MLECIRKILVPTDFSELSKDALRTAAEFARRDDASVHLLHSIRLPFLHTSYDVNVPEAVWEGLRKGTRERMAESQIWLEKNGISEVGTIVSEADQPAEAIRRSVQELDIDLVVMATHGRRGFKHAVVGSVTERTLRTSPVPVLAVKNGGITKLPLRRILLAIDFSNDSDSATALASSLARRYKAEIDVLHVFEPISDFMRHLSAMAVEFEEESRVISVDRLREVGSSLEHEELSVRTHLLDGNPAEVISAEADRLGSEIIVIGSQGHSGIDRAIIGSVAEHTLRLAPCSVLLTWVAD
jgi:nucleotide-binding universal stress UspA family protein